MAEPTYAQLRAVERVLMNRKGFRQEFDAITFHDEPESEDDEWTPIQREVLEDIARSVLEAEEVKA